jgi:hypothetical protein
VVGGVGDVELVGGTWVEDRRVEVADTLAAGEEVLEELRPGRVLVVRPVCAGPDRRQTLFEQRVSGDRAEQCAVHVTRLAVTDEELDRVVQQRLDRAEALEVGVDVHASVAPHDLEPEDVGAFPRRPRAVVDLRPLQPLGKVVVAPEMELPVRVVGTPGLLERGVLLRERLGAHPDLVEDPRDPHSPSQL